MIERPSPNFDARPAGIAIDMVILHYTGMADVEAALTRLCDPTAQVSAHYLIDEDGAVTRLVADAQRAWHAGAASWRRATNINARSIGIELANPGHDLGYRLFPEAQMAALEALLLEIVARHRIPPERILGHADVAPMRKRDPGEKFDWARLARAGLGLWPSPGFEPSPHAPALASGRSGPAVLGLQIALDAIGYAVEGTGLFDATTEAAVAAFQRHFRPDAEFGVCDPATLSLAYHLAER
jgi:N-acetylmuramoyl-L-alanine amidase